MLLSPPAPSNGFHHRHVQTLLQSYRHWTGRELLVTSDDPTETARRLYLAPFVVLSHDNAADPCFTYGNAAALQLFELGWSDLLQTHSRESAEPNHRAHRAELLQQVARYGFIENYSGVRISATGRRFRITGAVIWNLLDAERGYCGQAASFAHWTFI